jgi:hypothetical protein
MDISKYDSYFHDGSVINITYRDHEIILSLDSGQLSEEENPDRIPLSDHSTLKGKLHLEGVIKITDNDIPLTDNLQMLADSAEILHLNIQNNLVILNLNWINFPPSKDQYSFYCIECSKIWWENIPDLHDPFW